MHRSGLHIMKKLVVFIKPFIGIMALTILMGSLGFLSAIGITVLGVLGILKILDFSSVLNLSSLFIVIGVLALLRGILRYLEQSSGHYIAFKLLAFIRDKVFKALRRLAPAKLDGKESGKLISLITSDIELLEVFYAHTIAPVMIAVITSCTMLLIIGHFSLYLALITLVAYGTIGGFIPYFTSNSSRNYGRIYREQVGDINSYFLQSLRGMREIILFNEGEHRKSVILKKSSLANDSILNLKIHEGRNRAITDAAILGFSSLMLFSGIFLVSHKSLSFSGLLISLICLMSSYGPVVALSSLSNNLLQTFASGERVLDLLEERAAIDEMTQGHVIADTRITVSELDFTYGNELILNQLNLQLNTNQIIGISGKSGSGKSTLLKLLMRFYDPLSGHILFADKDIQSINTSSLRNTISYVTQDTYLFNDTIEENLRFAKRNATIDEIISACKKASIYDFIMQLPNAFQTPVGELGHTLSGGERQRLGLARAFLHPSKIILLDEPTSNLDSLNESIILQSLKKHSQDKTIILVSHRLSTLSIADKVYHLKSGRLC